MPGGSSLERLALTTGQNHVVEITLRQLLTFGRSASPKILGW